MHAPARTDYRIHRVHRPMIERGGMAQIFSPGARQTLTNDSRQKSGAVQAGEQWMHVGSLLPIQRIDMPPTASRSGAADASLSPIARRLAPHRCTEARITDAAAQKNGRSRSGHRIPAATIPDQ
ncbi:hypothetical protein MP631_08750 [Xanthomonas phaseoli pv. phaseoli]|nr:hypothetical protein MP631_08750 [Xanthomonas phaseoli pv. phaseoli]